MNHFIQIEDSAVFRAMTSNKSEYRHSKHPVSGACTFLSALLALFFHRLVSLQALTHFKCSPCRCVTLMRNPQREESDTTERSEHIFRQLVRLHCVTWKKQTTGPQHKQGTGVMKKSAEHSFPLLDFYPQLAAVFLGPAVAVFLPLSCHSAPTNIS